MSTTGHKVAFFGCLIAAAATAPASAREIQVQMKNSGKEGLMVFEPSFIKANVGDVVKFVPTDLSHNAESIPTMAPARAPSFKGALNKPIALTVTERGLYGVKCAPHLGMGMVALIQAGKVSSSELTAARAVKLPPLAAKRMNAAFALVR